MKHLAMLISSACLLAVPALPARASLVAETPPAVDNMHCLTLLLTDPDAHAAECGGPFTIDKGTSPLVNGNYTEGCHQIAMVTLPSLAEDWLISGSDVARVHVAAPVQCCNASFLTPEFLDLTLGETIRVAVSCS